MNVNEYVEQEAQIEDEQEQSEMQAEQEQQFEQQYQQPQSQQGFDMSAFYQQMQATAQLEAEKQLAVDRFRRERPELQNHESYIQFEAQNYAMEQMRQNKYVSPSQALQEGIKRFESNMPQLKQKEPKKNQFYEMLDAGDGKAPSTPQDAVKKISSMPSGDFRKLAIMAADGLY